MRPRTVMGLSSGLRRAARARALLGPIALLTLLPLPLFLFSCAGSSSMGGGQLLRSGDYAAAVEKLRPAEAADPANAAIKRDLGVALLESGDASGGFAKLSESRDLDPKDARTLFFLGKAAEKTGRTSAALSAYGDYMAASGADLNRDQRAALLARMEDLSQQQVLAEIRRAIAREESLRTTRVPENSVAVSDFLNAAGSDTLAPLSRGLAAMVVTDLSKVRKLRVLERERIRVLLDELKLSAEGTGAGASPGAGAGSVPPSWSDWSPIESALGLKQRLKAVAGKDGQPYFNGRLDDVKDEALLDAVTRFQRDEGLTADGIAGRRTREALTAKLDAALAEWRAQNGVTERPAVAPSASRAVDSRTAPRLGQILGARRFVQGSFVPAEDAGISLDATLVSIPDGTQTPAGNGVQGELRDVLRLEKKLVYQILAALGIEPAPDERKEIDRIPTRSFLAFLAFSRGLDFEERGMGDRALQSYRDALRADPRFGLARAREEIRAVTAEDQRSLERAEAARLAPEEGGARARLVRTGTANGLGPGPENDRGDEADISNTPANRVDGNVMGEIIVEGDLPEERP